MPVSLWWSLGPPPHKDEAALGCHGSAEEWSPTSSGQRSHQSLFAKHSPSVFTWGEAQLPSLTPQSSQV